MLVFPSKAVVVFTEEADGTDMLSGYVLVRLSGKGILTGVSRKGEQKGQWRLVVMRALYILTGVWFVLDVLRTMNLPFMRITS